MNSTPIDSAALVELDRRHIWHPYSSMFTGNPPLPVVAAHGVHLELADGRQLIDGMSSWWSAIHGYNHPVINAAAKAQIDQMSHVMFGGLTHPPAVELAKLLADITPAGLDKVFFSDSGSVAVEVAIKMAIQYWGSQGQARKHRLLTIRSGYHGDTFATMAVCDPVTGMHHLFRDVLTQHLFAPSPRCQFGGDFDDQDITEFEQLIAAHHNELAAVILEPIVQGAGGMKFYHPEYLQKVRQLCDQYEVLLVCDEIATGFGRTGKLFACEHAGISPDILCVGKSLTGGYVTLAATLCTDRVARGICEGEAGVFMHGPTFMANPLATAIAGASIRLLLSQPWQTMVSNLEQRLQAGLEPAKSIAGVADVRVLGSIGVIEMEAPINIVTAQERFVSEGVWLRPFGKLLYTIPPYTINEEEVSIVTRAMIRAIS